jgi:GMP synthase-like glutamine amidotransferase
MFRALLSEAADALGVGVGFRTWSVEVEACPETLEACDVYLITGSRRSVYEDLPWIHALEDFVRRLHAARHPLIGICFGHQLIARALGGVVGKAAVGWGVGSQRYEVVAPRPWMVPPCPGFALLASHQDQVETLPPGAQRFAGSSFCPNAGFTIDDYFIALQAHPEFREPYSRDLLHKRRERLGEPVFEAGLASLGGRIDAPLIARWLLQFVLARAVPRAEAS